MKPTGAKRNPISVQHAGEGGAALLTVLSVLTVLGIAVSILIERTRGDIKPWARETETTQAVYAAESGIAYQLYLERFSDSAEPSFGVPKEADPKADPFLKPLAPTDTFVYRMDTSQGIPEVSVDRTRAFLDITSKGK
jgi:hypothetical protein